jgi:hypothetical protein
MALGSAAADKDIESVIAVGAISRLMKIPKGVAS